jgi:hypothetical protein
VINAGRPPGAFICCDVEFSIPLMPCGVNRPTSISAPLVAGIWRIRLLKDDRYSIVFLLLEGQSGFWVIINTKPRPYDWDKCPDE